MLFFRIFDFLLEIFCCFAFLCFGSTNSAFRSKSEFFRPELTIASPFVFGSQLNLKCGFFNLANTFRSSAEKMIFLFCRMSCILLDMSYINLWFSWIKLSFRPQNTEFEGFSSAPFAIQSSILNEKGIFLLPFIVLRNQTPALGRSVHQHPWSRLISWLIFSINNRLLTLEGG